MELLFYLSVVAVNHLPEVDAETRSDHFPAVVFEFTPLKACSAHSVFTPWISENCGRC